MKAISIRQPWASMIIRPKLTDPAERAKALAAGEIKLIENRDWPTKVRGRVLVHAAKGCTVAEAEDAIDFAEAACGIRFSLDLKTIPRGGIIGSVEIVDCVTESPSRWFMGKYGFVLRNPLPMPFVPFKGALGFFEVPDDLLKGCAQ